MNTVSNRIFLLLQWTSSMTIATCHQLFEIVKCPAVATSPGISRGLLLGRTGLRDGSKQYALSQLYQIGHEHLCLGLLLLRSFRG